MLKSETLTGILRSVRATLAAPGGIPPRAVMEIYPHQVQTDQATGLVFQNMIINNKSTTRQLRVWGKKKLNKLNLHVHVSHWCRVELDVGRLGSPSVQTRRSAVTNGWTDYSAFHSVIVDRGRGSWEL